MWVKLLTSVQLGVKLTEKLNRKLLIFLNAVFNFKCLPLYNFKRFQNIFIFRNYIAVSIIMSQVCHNVQNVTHMVHIMLEQAQFNDRLRWLYNLGIVKDVPYHPYLDEYIYDILTVGICNRFYDFLALHICRPRSNYDVRLYSTA